MAQDINHVVIIGRLTRDLGTNERDFGYAQNGMAVATISIAVNRSKKQPDGSYAEEVSYFDVKIYGKTAENLKPYLTKGKQVGIDGMLKQDRWQDNQTGRNMSRVYINALSVELLGGGNNQQQSQPQSSYAQQYQQQSQPVQQSFDNGFPEDIPF